MRQIRYALARIAGLFRGDDADKDMRAEFEAHIEMETAELIRRGMHPAEARRQAILASGGMSSAAEAVRDQRGLPFIETLLADIRYAFRTLTHAKAYAVVAILTIALGIGANTAIFSVVRGVLLKGLPHEDGDHLVYLRHWREGASGTSLSFSVPEVREFRSGVPSLRGIAEYSPWFHTLHGEGDAVSIDAGLVTGNFFEVMGLAPILGRVTDARDDGPTAAPVMVLTHELWKSRFAGDSSVIGRQVKIDGGTATIVGVMEPAPYFPDPVEAFFNMVVSPHHISATMTEGRTHRMTEIIARFGRETSLDQVRRDVDAVYARMQSEHREAYDAASNYRVSVLPFREALGERARLTVLLLMGAAGFVLIIAAANVTNLTLMRGVRREQEMVVRAALGAGVSRLRRLLLAENLLLTFAGAALGVIIAVAGVDMLVAFAARYSPRAQEIALDGTVLLFALALSVILALILSYIAALPREGTFASRISVGSSRTTGGLRKQRMQRALVVTQVAVSVVLLAGAGLMTRTVFRLAGVHTGLMYEEVLTIPVHLLDPARVSPQTDVANKLLYERMRSDLAQLPGVIEVGLGSTMPLQGSILGFDVKVDGKTLAAGEAVPRAELRTASPEYLRAAGIPLLKGRDFLTTDGPGGARVAIVNQAFVDRLFKDEDPIGKRVAFTGEVLRFTPISGEWRTIIGVVGNTQDGGLAARPRLAIFAPFAQEFAVRGGLVVRTQGDAEALASAATRIVRRIAPTIPVEDVRTVRQMRDESLAPRRLNAALIGSFGLLAVIIAAVGVGGVLAFSVSARTNEIGIRMSLGAAAAQIQRMILAEGSKLVGLGLVFGVVGAFFAVNVMRGFLFGIEPRDGPTFIAVAIAMAAIGILACWIPARRAARVDPAIAMKS